MSYPANHFLGSRRNGLNHVSMNMGDFNRTSGPARGTNYPVYSDALLNWYATKQVQCVRVMFTWEAVQSSLGGPVPPAAGAGYANYWADLTSVITRLLARGIYVILSPWQFNTASGDTDIVYDDASFTAADFANFWGKFAAAVNLETANDQRVAFDLINEPHTHAESGNRPGDIGITPAAWFACAQAAITAIRGAGVANTILVPGMAYAAASSFTTNGSAAPWLALNDPLKNIAVTAHCYTGLGSSGVTVLRDACATLVAWARTNGVKVNIGEIAINAGANGRTTFCGTFAIATAQWADWTSFNEANSDVLVGWNWWANSAANWWNQGDSCDPAGYHWGLTLDDGATQTVYMDLIEATLPVPRLGLRDNSADVGAEPNPTTTVGWESPDVWVRQFADGGLVGEPVQGGQPSAVYVKITNRGLAASEGNEEVRLYWAKASAGLSWPKPWDGSVALQGGTVAPPQSTGVILPGQTGTLLFNWASTPNPADYGNDGHFCLLAMITTPSAPAFPEFEGTNLNQNVLKLSNVAWRNIHIVPTAKMEMGDLVIENQSDRPMRAQVAFEVLDEAGRTTRPNAGVVLTPNGIALEKLRQRELDGVFENLGNGRYQLRDAGTGIPQLDLLPGDVLHFGVEYVAEDETRGHAIRATQFAMEGTSRTTIGGQTFVAGEVAGFTAPPPRRRRPWPWAGGCLSLLLLFGWLVRRKKKSRD